MKKNVQIVEPKIYNREKWYKIGNDGGKFVWRPGLESSNLQKKGYIY